ncbi:NAD(P)-binding protein [Bradyrhizobium sp. 180]|uniref:FAD-dependent oxidoreductase n=1 Tax=unclassified Bradyrhizobium TaxID=2631580 RepID=UPI001FF82E87|nr:MULTISPECIES: FAD-dependent oxidoreductase [unclassified Bradyrhizobium]MCK1423586.1 NAD(P)-binding protein [Bradyrhizobium sp. CW12]MCK1494369.1 NAD(P)-binding protein [Bradyrhizobium sp. 180]MCK1531642.1 NAD(P)-binding protein [Bradyrhizobium sp. 182]MCK1594994.1 NAD(P)-binding protein [Bradyrhizobium sp. 164]MCK1647078.1 NAD(P)-binding protein [Bradyrhizobium sp. 154]
MAKQKIAILGGGMAGLSAAYHLTKTHALRDRYEVAVYQLGWRLGGKAASGRDDLGRNLEHGLHVWFGCYENTFQMLQELYAANPPGGMLTDWTAAVTPQSYTPIGVYDNGRWTYWPLTWPTNDGTPGDGTLLPSWGQMMQMVAGWIAEAIERRLQQPAPAEAVAAAGWLPPTGALALSSDTATPAGAVRAAQNHLRAHGSDLRKLTEQDMKEFHDLVRWARDALAGRKFVGEQRAEFVEASPLDHRILTEVLDIFAATSAGIFWDLVVPDRPLEALDGYDFRAWLINHGANPTIVNTSSVIRVLYDTLYQYEDGDVSRPSYAAGSGLGVIMRLIGTYKGAMMWDIQAGMGEVIVAPLYEHLVSLGVSFKFFRKVTHLGLSPDGTLIQTIRMDKQVETISGDYQPTYDLADGLTVWPAEPLWEQLVDGAEMKAAKVNFESYWCDRPPVGPPEELHLGTDFHIAVLAISLGAYKPLNGADASMCAELIAKNGAFASYVQNVGVVPTQSVQLWCDPTSAGLGWTTGKAATVSGPEYLNIWADMTQVLPFETWQGPRPQSLHYLTGTYKTTLFRQPSSNTGVPAQAHDEIRTQAIAWLNESSYGLWPLADPNGAFDFDVLHVTEPAVGTARFNQQFWRANIDPTECCTLSAAGTTQYRLHPDQTGFNNLILAGEGSRHGFNTTAIEGAVMSGAAAARAISGAPAHIVGYDFLQRRPSQGPGT